MSFNTLTYKINTYSLFAVLCYVEFYKLSSFLTVPQQHEKQKKVIFFNTTPQHMPHLTCLQKHNILQSYTTSIHKISFASLAQQHSIVVKTTLVRKFKC